MIGGDTRTWDMQVFQPHYFQAGTNRLFVRELGQVLTLCDGPHRSAPQSAGSDESGRLG